jgi:hypothetical protein
VQRGLEVQVKLPCFRLAPDGLLCACALLLFEMVIKVVPCEHGETGLTFKFQAVIFDGLIRIQFGSLCFSPIATLHVL